MSNRMTSFTRLLEECAKVLHPFINASRRGDLHWNGDEYAPVTQDHEPDPYALAWWSTLHAISALLASQPAITREQYSYLEGQLFGGIGSLNDFCLDAKRWGNKAEAANEQLDKIRTELYSAFQALRPVEHAKV